MFCYRTHREMSYLDALNGVPTSTIDEWSGMDFVAQDAWVWLKAYVRVDSRYIRESAFWDGCNEERRWMSRWGREIPLHALHVFSVRASFVANAFPEVMAYGQLI